MSKAPVETWSFWAPLTFATLCLLTGVFLHKFAFPTLERSMYKLSKRLREYPKLVLVIEESVAHTLIPSLSRCLLMSCIYGKGRTPRTRDCFVYRYTSVRSTCSTRRTHTAREACTVLYGRPCIGTLAFKKYVCYNVQSTFARSASAARRTHI